SRTGAVLEKGAGGAFKDFPFEWNKRSEVDPVLRKFRSIAHHGLIDPSLLRDRLQAKKKRVAGHARQALVRRVSITRRSKRQHLPHALAAGYQKIDKSIGRTAQVANSIIPGKRCRMK